jgi:hypothetical protein
MFLILLSLLAQLSLAGFPAEVCNSDVCSSQQQEILAEMLRAKRNISSFKTPSFYSGPCFWRGLYDPTVEHHGGFLIYAKEGEMYQTGRFSFFADQNPYRDYSIEEAIEAIGLSAKRPVEHHKDYTYHDALPGSDNPVWYWSRSSSDSQYLYLMAFWGNNHLALCKLERHP